VLRTLLRPRRVLLLAIGSLAAGACIISSNTETAAVSRAALTGTVVRTPFRAHLLDGDVIVFDEGATVDSTHVSGSGRRFDVMRTASVPSTGIALDSVLGFEVYQRTVNPGRTILYSTAATAASVVGTAALAVAIFGSCPTIYADSAGVPTLQAESFSYSIAPLLAKRDVDRMTVTPGADGVIRLAVRNEALETHHLDQMEIVEIRHAPGEVAYPSPRGGALIVSEPVRAASVRDGAGRDVSRLVARRDDAAFSTDDGLLDRAIAGGPVEDQLTIAIPRRSAGDSMALVLRARSSLLTTSVLYEHLMGRQGALALDWMGRDLARITSLAKLGAWYGSNFGMRVEVQDGGRWRPVIRLMDFGPTAWRDVGVALPTTSASDDSVRVRLTFPADAFRIDQAALAYGARRAEQRRIPVSRATDSHGADRPDLVAMLARADERDVETHPGDRFWIEFDAGRAAPEARTFFFAAQGYYVEWLRPAWMKRAAAAQAFSPANTSMRDLLRSWKGGRDSLEAQFFVRRVPIT
jgi:hypothetical protein